MEDMWQRLFFFSSRRRHTRSLCDWSSDVCSSDLPTSPRCCGPARSSHRAPATSCWRCWSGRARSEEHTSELQSHSDLVCRLLLEKKKAQTTHDDKRNRISKIEITA